MTIRTMIFDLDGTLVQTEQLKAVSYAKATVELCPMNITESEVIEAFKDVVGMSRREVALALIKRFKLEDLASNRMEEFGVSTAWQAFVQVRLAYYNRLIADPQTLKKHEWAHNVHLLNVARQNQCHTALATMSYREQVSRILDILDFTAKFDFIATREDVANGKPDPEIYLLVAHELGVLPADCLVIEDSLVGVEAALAAKMHVIAVTTPFTRDALHQSDILDKRWIVDDPMTLLDTVQHVVNLHG